MNITLSTNGAFLLHTSETTTLEIPCDARGARAIYDILLARSLDESAKIGNLGKPTQWQIDQYLLGKRARPAPDLLDQLLKEEPSPKRRKIDAFPGLIIDI